MDPILIGILIFTGLGITGSHMYHSDLKEKNDVLAKNITSKVIQLTREAAKKDYNYIDGKGIDLNYLKINQNGDYFPIYLNDNTNFLKDFKDANVSVIINPITENRLNCIIDVQVGNSEQTTLVPISRIVKNTQIPLIYSKNLKTKDLHYSTYSYDKKSKTIGCMTNPHLLLSYLNKKNIDNISLLIPKYPCSNITKDFNIAFKNTANISNINFIDTVFSEKGVKLTNSIVKKAIVKTNNITKVGLSNIEQLEINKNYNFPNIKNFKKNYIDFDKDLYSYKYDKICHSGEILFIGNGSLRSLDIKKGCSSVVFQGSNFTLGSLVVEVGAKTRMDFSEDATLNIVNTKLKTFSKIYLNTLNNSQIKVYGDYMQIGENAYLYSDMFDERKVGNSSIECVHPGSCLYDMNRILLFSESSISGDLIAEDLLVAKNSYINGHILANNAIITNTEVSNIVNDDDSQIINKEYSKFFSMTPFAYDKKTLDCENIKDCKLKSYLMR